MEFLGRVRSSRFPHTTGKRSSEAAAESAAAAKLAEEGIYLVRLWRRPLVVTINTVGLYRADSEAELYGLLDALPIADWLRVTVTPLERTRTIRSRPRDENRLPILLCSGYRLEAVLGDRSTRRGEPGTPANRPADRRHL